jgi:hypothetical protein
VRPAPKGDPIASGPRTAPGDVVFESIEGTRGVAIVMTRDFDPRGELSAGIAVLLSDNGGATWGRAYHTGLASGFPYRMRATRTAPMFDGDTLQLPVDIEEIDPQKVTLPPTRAGVKRAQSDLVVRIPIAALKRDDDGDGLTDIEEERLVTDPRARDTDGDGLFDADDPLPLQGRDDRAEEPRARFLRLFFAHEEATPARGRLENRLVESTITQLPAGARTINLRGLRDAYEAKLGVVYPPAYRVLLDQSGWRAIIEVDERWRAATYLVEALPHQAPTVRRLSP